MLATGPAGSWALPEHSVQHHLLSDTDSPLVLLTWAPAAAWIKHRTTAGDRLNTGARVRSDQDSCQGPQKRWWFTTSAPGLCGSASAGEMRFLPLFQAYTAVNMTYFVPGL